MPDVPRDPRQLARDILAGRVKIEDLARERQMRAPAPTPQRVPLPKTPPPRPLQNAPRPPMPQRPVQPPPQRRPAPPRPQQARPGYAPPPPPRPAYTPPEAPTPIQQESSSPTEGFANATAAPKKRPLRLRDLTRSKHALRQGFILSEVLGKPLSLRDE